MREPYQVDRPAARGRSGEAVAPTPRRRRRRVVEQGARGYRDDRSSLIIFGLLSVATVGSLLALGAVHVTALLVIVPCGFAAGVLAIAREGRTRLPTPAGILVGLSAFSALQALPLPMGWLEWLDASSAGIWKSALQPLGEETARASISLDPGASMVESLKWLCYASVFIAGAGVTARRSLRWVCGLIFGAAVLAALTTLAHRLVGAEAFLGVYRPVYAAPKFAAAPLLNANNLAGYLNLGAFVGIGLIVSRRQVLPIWLMGLGVAVVVGVSAASGSRAGLTALLFGVAVTILTLKLRRFEGRSMPRAVTWLVAAALLGGLVLFVLGADRDVRHALFEEGAEKLALISWTRPLVAQHPWLGVGRGAFETAFPAYRADQGHHIYQFAENFVMQWCCEWGIPVSLVAMGGLVWCLRPARLGIGRSPLAFVSFIGVLVLLAQNLLDLALEIPAVSIALFTLLGALWAGGNSEERGASLDLGWTRQPGLVLGLASLAIWTSALLVGTHTAIRDRRSIAAALRALPATVDEAAAGRAELRDQLRRAIHRHPADPFLPLVGALSARIAGDNPLPWLSRAIERDPMGGRPYLVLANELAERGVKLQALLSIRQAIEREAALARTGVRLAVTLSQDFDELKSAVPEGLAGANVLTSLAAQPEVHELRARLLEFAITKDRQIVRPRVLLAEDLLTSLSAGIEPCAGERKEGCTARITELSQEIERVGGSRETTVVFKARLLALAERLPEAVTFLAAACPQFDPGLECLRWEVSFAQRAKDRGSLERAAGAYLAAACQTPVACAVAATWLGSQYEGAGADAQALRMYERAAREADTSQAWHQVDRLASRMGFVGAASRARHRASALPNAPPPAPAGSSADRERLRELIDDSR